LEERDDDDEEESGPAVLPLGILVAFAVIILALALVAGLAWRLSGR
jgi:hypothetical protein